MYGNCARFPARAIYPLWGANPARFCSQGQVWEDSECSPTSARDAPHSCLISAWHKHECTTTTHVWGASLADVGLHLESSYTPP